MSRLQCHISLPKISELYSNINIRFAKKGTEWFSCTWQGRFLHLRVSKWFLGRTPISRYRRDHIQIPQFVRFLQPGAQLANCHTATLKTYVFVQRGGSGGHSWGSHRSTRQWGRQPTKREYFSIQILRQTRKWVEALELRFPTNSFTLWDNIGV